MKFSRIALCAAVLALVVILVPAAFAGHGKPGGGGGSTTGGSSSLSLVLLNSTDGLPHWGQQVTFSFSTSYSTPTVSLSCYQGGALVASGSHPMYSPNIWDDPGIFTLSSLAWTSGAADCTATLNGQSNNGKPTTLASLSFHVYA
jgi:hypothetical protein